MVMNSLLNSTLFLNIILKFIKFKLIFFKISTFPLESNNITLLSLQKGFCSEKLDQCSFEYKSVKFQK